MSQYLIARIEAAENIEVRLPDARSGRRGGDGHLESLTLADRDTGDTEEVPATWLFVFIGAAPRTDWLGDEVRPRRPRLRGHRAGLPPSTRPGWPLTRPPYALETSVPGVFAAGDVRLDSMKRVASAVGEGAMAIHLVHRYLATI